MIKMNSKIPVVLDTDIGTDIDDTWALAMLLNCPELDVKLIVSATEDTEYRAKIIAKYLEVAGRTDIPVGIGKAQKSEPEKMSQLAWVEDYKLDSYPGTVYKDGVQAMIETINSSNEPISVICIGPLTNIGEALKRDPNFVRNANFVGMQGSVNKKHLGKEGAIAEYNVLLDVPACQAVFQAPWISLTITPLDTCGIVVLDGELYRKVLDSEIPKIQALMDNYQIWADGKASYNAEEHSSVLYDTVAVHLAFSTEFLKMEELGIDITDDGFTVVNPESQKVNCAMDWIDLEAFKEYLVKRLLQ